MTTSPPHRRTAPDRASFVLAFGERPTDALAAYHMEGHVYV